MKNSITTVAICCLLGISSMNSQVTEKENDMPKDMEGMKHDKTKMDHGQNKVMNHYIKDWPMASQKAVEATKKAYGEPSASSENEIVWRNAGIWEMIRVSKKESPHKFPVAHTDMMEMTIYHNVPVEKMSALGAFDGSVTFDRTQGYLSARCDVEANNFLALNLAHDIINGKKNVEEARTAFADIIKEKMEGKDPEYMQKLQFNVETEKAADPDINTTGLTKEDVMAAIKKNSKM